MGKINGNIRKALEDAVRECVDMADCKLIERVLDIILLHRCKVCSASAKEIEAELTTKGMSLLRMAIGFYENDVFDFPYQYESGYLYFSIDCLEIDGKYDIQDVFMRCGLKLDSYTIINNDTNADAEQQEEKPITFADKASIVSMQYDKWNIPIALLSKSENIYDLIERLYVLLVKYPVVDNETYNQWITRVAIGGYDHHQKKMGVAKKEPTREAKLKRIEERNKKMQLGK